MRESNAQVAIRVARILGTTAERCEEMLRAGNDAGLSTAYMLGSIEYAYGKGARKKKLQKLLGDKT